MCLNYYEESEYAIYKRHIVIEFVIGSVISVVEIYTVFDICMSVMIDFKDFVDKINYSKSEYKT